MEHGSCEGGSCGAVLLMIPVLAAAGYLARHFMDQPAPWFEIER